MDFKILPPGTRLAKRFADSGITYFVQNAARSFYFLLG
jgi:hypothetical protein